MNIKLWDIVSKIKEFFLDYFFLPYWKIKLNSLGNNSIIKRGVKIIGSGRRLSVGDNFKIWHRCLLTTGKGKIIIGSNGHLGVDVYINATKGNVKIGDNVSIAPKTQIFSYSDDFTLGKLIGETHKVADINICDNVLIGSGVIILPGITIHKGVIVAAGAVVTKDVPENTIVAGIPAKKIKMRE